VGESFPVGLPVGGSAGKFGDFGDKRFVGLTPIDDDFVSRHRLLSPSGGSFFLPTSYNQALTTDAARVPGV